MSGLVRSAVGRTTPSRHARPTPLGAGGGAPPPSAGRARYTGGGGAPPSRRPPSLGRTPTGGLLGGVAANTTGALAAAPSTALAAAHAAAATAAAAPPPITFQDFLREVDLQFLDHMRRGTSISLADLAGPAPPPANLRDAYVLMCVTAPEVAALEAGVGTLRDEVAARKATIVDKEAALARTNPPLFAAVQTATASQLEGLRAEVALLKRVCRARTAVAWKEWRAKQEADRAGSLASHLDLLRADAARLDDALAAMRGVAAATRAWAAAQRSALEDAAAGRQAARARAAAAAAAAAEVDAATSANASRRARAAAAAAALEHATASAASAAERRAAAAAAAEDARAAADAEAAATEAAGRAAVAADVASRADALALLSGLAGWRLDAGLDARAGRVAASFGRAGVVRLTLDARAGGGGVRAHAEAAGGGSASSASSLPSPPWLVELGRGLVCGAGAPFAPRGAGRRAAAPAWAAAAGRAAAAAGVLDAAADAVLGGAAPAISAIVPVRGGVALTVLDPRGEALFEVRLPLGDAADGGGGGGEAAGLAVRVRVAPPGKARPLAAAAAAAVVAATAGAGDRAGRSVAAVAAALDRLVREGIVEG